MLEDIKLDQDPKAVAFTGLIKNAVEGSVTVVCIVGCAPVKGIGRDFAPGESAVVSGMLTDSVTGIYMLFVQQEHSYYDCQFFEVAKYFDRKDIYIKLLNLQSSVYRAWDPAGMILYELFDKRLILESKGICIDREKNRRVMHLPSTGRKDVHGVWVCVGDIIEYYHPYRACGEVFTPDKKDAKGWSDVVMDQSPELVAKAMEAGFKHVHRWRNYLVGKEMRHFHKPAIGLVRWDQEWLCYAPLVDEGDYMYSAIGCEYVKRIGSCFQSAEWMRALENQEV